MTNRPINFIDPTGHMRTDENGSSKKGCSDPEYCQDGKPNPPEPPRPPVIEGVGGIGVHTKNGENEPLDSLLDVADNYNYSVGSNNIPLYQYYSWMFDMEVTGQFGLVYANNSPLTINLDPTGLNLRHAYFQSNDGFSLNYGTQPSLGYAQSLPHSVVSSVTGININPITGGVTSNLLLGLDGPISYRQSVTVRATVRPMETIVATIGGAIALSQVIPGPLDDVGIAAGTYRLCQATGLCP